MEQDRFAHKAGSYEQSQRRVDNVGNIARAIGAAVTLAPDMHLLDFGSGTGLLLERLAPQVGRITAVDVSPAMNAQLRAKQAHLPCATEIFEVDLETADVPGLFDGVVSSMAMHHVRDVPALFRKFHGMLRPGGFVAVADLDFEDGSFHQEDTGVFHTGFERAAISAIAAEAGFRAVRVESASTISKPQGDYGVFLLTAVR